MNLILVFLTIHFYFQDVLIGFKKNLMIFFLFKEKDMENEYNVH